MNIIRCSFQSVWNVSEVAFLEQTDIETWMQVVSWRKERKRCKTNLKRCWFRSTWGWSREGRIRPRKSDTWKGQGMVCFPIYGLSCTFSF